MKVSKILNYLGTALVGGGAAALASTGLAHMQSWTPKYRAAVLAGLGGGLGLAAQMSDNGVVNDIGKTVAAGTVAIAGSDAIQLYGLEAQVSAALGQTQPAQTAAPAATAPSGAVYPQLTAGAQQRLAAAQRALQARVY